MKLDVGVLHLKRPLSTIVPSAREDRYISTSLFCPFLSVRCHFMLNPLQDTCQGEARCLQHCCVCCFEPVEPANMDPSPRVPPSQRLPWPRGERPPLLCSALSFAGPTRHACVAVWCGDSVHWNDHRNDHQFMPFQYQSLEVNDLI